MKIISRLGAVWCALLVSMLAHAQTSPDAALNALHEAGADANQPAFVALLTNDVVFFGMDGSARLEGESVRDFVSERFYRGDEWAYRSSDRAVRLSTDGAVAWFDESLMGGELRSARGTGVLIREGESWKIAQYNLTQVTPDDAEREPLERRSFFGQEARSPAAPPSSKCRKMRHKTNKKGDC